MVEIITQKITKHHELYSLPVLGEYWEELLHQAFVQSGQKSDWQPNRSHAIGKDIHHEEHGRISCKSGEYNIKKKILRINGSRTTKYKTLEEKIKFLSENKDDVYYCLARNKKEWKDGLRKYYLFIFKSDILNLGEQQWEETRGGWKCACEKYEANISRATSDQLWVSFNVGYLPEPVVITL